MALRARALAGAALLSVLLAGCAHRDAPRAYPDIDHDSAPARLAVVEVIASDYLPEFPECQEADVICMDPAPTWIKLTTLDTVSGPDLPRTFYASTTSHYGKITAYGLAEGPQLMLLLGEGDGLVMARYARAPLAADAGRRFHLLLHNQGPDWLPCEARALREPITDPALARAGAVPRRLFDETRDETSARYYRIEHDFAYPRYSLLIGKLGDLLGGDLRPASAYRCSARRD